jgi:hypothetical protein
MWAYLLLGQQVSVLQLPGLHLVKGQAQGEAAARQYVGAL